MTIRWETFFTILFVVLLLGVLVKYRVLDNEPFRMTDALLLLLILSVWMLRFQRSSDG